MYMVFWGVVGTEICSHPPDKIDKPPTTIIKQ
jgi:hypothetical protein